MSPYQNYIKELVKSEKNEMQFENCEELDRITSILALISRDNNLKESVALKGSAAINVVLFSSLEIPSSLEFDLSKETLKEDASKIKDYIINKFTDLLEKDDYNAKVNSESEKCIIELTYTNALKNKEKLKLVFNFKADANSMDNVKIKFVSKVFEHKDFTVNCVHPIEIFAETINSLINNPTENAIKDLSMLTEYEIFYDAEKEMLGNCISSKYSVKSIDEKILDKKFENNNLIDNKSISSIKEYLADISERIQLATIAE